jgi:predicted O-methyltransferase YrrM
MNTAKALSCAAVAVALALAAAAPQDRKSESPDGAGRPAQLDPALAAKAEAVLKGVERECRSRYVYMVGPKRGARLAELVRARKPRLVVECGTGIGYSGLWIARELKALGAGKLLTIEIDPARAREARENFKAAGLDGVVEVRTGDSVLLAPEITEPIDFVFLDCNYANYLPTFEGLEARLTEGAVVVADNAGSARQGLATYLEHVRTRYESKTEPFQVDLPWNKSDAMEVTFVRNRKPAPAPATAKPER